MTPVSTHPAQALLRVDPEAAIMKFGFRVTNTIYTNTTLGGPCSLICSKFGGNIYTLDAQAGAGDFFFPYVHVTQGGVGTCIVPSGLGDGVLVVTGGMNGCALQVNQHGGNLHFYHDANGNSMAGKLTPGEIVCRIEYDQYAGFEHKGEQIAIDYMGKKKGSGMLGMDTSQMYHEYYLITVKQGGVWKVYASTLLRKTARKVAFWSGKSYTDTELQTFMPKKVKLVGIFAAP